MKLFNKVKNFFIKEEKLIKYGWKKDKSDYRDHLFAHKATPPKKYTPVDLRDHCPPVMDQGELGACTAFGTTAMVHFVRNKQKLENFVPSPLFPCCLNSLA